MRMKCEFWQDLRFIAPKFGGAVQVHNGAMYYIAPHLPEINILEKT